MIPKNVQIESHEFFICVYVSASNGKGKVFLVLSHEDVLGEWSGGIVPRIP
jgi:hypothetical protein